MDVRHPLITLSRFRVLRMVVAIAIVGFVCSAVYIAGLLLQRQAALSPVGRGNVTWMIAQGPSEFARLEQRISQLGMTGRAVDAAEVRLRFDIVVNRLRTLKSEEVAKFIGADPQNAEILLGFEKAIEAARPLLDRLSEPGTPARLLDVLAPIYPKLTRLSVNANVWNAARLNEERQDLFNLQWIFASVAAALILCGVVFIILLLLHNRLLMRAQTRLRQQEVSLHTQNRRFNAALNNMSQGLCLVDAEQRVIVCNARFLTLFNLDAETVQEGVPLGDLVPPQMLPLAPASADAGWTEGTNVEQMTARNLGDRTHRMAGGSVVHVAHEAMEDGGWVSTFEDVTERRRAQDRIVHMAHHDALTGMPNRLLFWESTARAIGRLEASDQRFAIFYLDLDRFKEVNDTVGHPVGDALLCAVAERLQAAVPATDLVARLGGDEFAVLHLFEERSTSSTTELAEKIISELSRPYLLSGRDIVISTSIGISIAPQDGRATEDLMKNADLALYRAKECGGRTYQCFDPELQARLQSRRQLEVDLRRGIALGQFELFYQPMMSMSTNRIVCGEALLRWNHPDRGTVLPSVFIPLAEETGLIESLGEWALEEACRVAARWPEGIRVAVNLSPVQFRDSLLGQRVERALTLSGLPTHRLELEITESVLLQNNAANLDVLHRLRARGLSIALDDFGTGYSSLSYLQLFPFDKIKIDQSFVRDLESRSDSIAIIQSIASLAKRLKMVTTAEGVETLGQLNIITAAGCTEAQGFYFSRPLREPDFRALLFAQDIKTSTEGGQLGRRSRLA